MCRGVRGWCVLLVLAVIVCGGCARQAAQPWGVEPIENGVYAVLGEGATEAEAREGHGRCVVLVYDKNYADASPIDPVHVAIDTASYVPLILEGVPDARKDDAGKTILSVTLQDE